MDNLIIGGLQRVTDNLRIFARDRFPRKTLNLINELWPRCKIRFAALQHPVSPLTAGSIPNAINYFQNGHSSEGTGRGRWTDSFTLVLISDNANDTGASR